jgi:hypothetical protein
VIAMPAFRRLCPELLLRPGDDVESGRVAIVFTDRAACDRFTSMSSGVSKSAKVVLGRLADHRQQRQHQHVGCTVAFTVDH